MKNIFYLFLAVFSLLVIGCEQIVDVQETTKIVYITPIWKGEFPSHPNNPEIGWAYYNITVGKSFIFDGTNWQIMSQDGIDGTSIIWKGELSSAPKNPQINWAYYNTTDGCSYIYNGSEWTIISKNGKDGIESEISPSASTTNSFIFIKETIEVINEVSYNVKCYAECLSAEPYFYIYHKYYYLNNKLQKTYTFSHRQGSCLNYKYTEFVEHYCFSHSKLEHFYDENGNCILNISSVKQNGKIYTTEYIWRKEGDYKLYIYCIDNLISQFYYRYDSGYLKYYFIDNILYCYEDTKTTTASTTSNIYSSKQSYSQEDIVNLIDSLKRTLI